MRTIDSRPAHSHLRVLLFHPEDEDGDVLIEQLQRIGCQVMAFGRRCPSSCHSR